MKRISIIIFLLIMAGCSVSKNTNSRESQDPPQLKDSIADYTLTHDVYQQITNKIEVNYQCSNISVSSINLIDAKKEFDNRYRASERWHVNACKQPIPFIVNFIPDKTGGTLFSVEEEKMIVSH